MGGTSSNTLKKNGLIGLQEAADYLDTSHQWLGQMLNGEEDHPLRGYFRHYAGRWRTTYALLDEYFTSGSVQTHKVLQHEQEKIFETVLTGCLDR